MSNLELRKVELMRPRKVCGVHVAELKAGKGPKEFDELSCNEFGLVQARRGNLLGLLHLSQVAYVEASMEDDEDDIKPSAPAAVEPETAAVTEAATGVGTEEVPEVPINNLAGPQPPDAEPCDSEPKTTRKVTRRRG